ncbi:MAG TPA: CvpA family protein [Hyphomicrobiaceae bacterium]|jgi:membrane protein required for colicin V production
MGSPSPLDAAILAPAAILGLMGLWLGFGRSLAAWPMRWLVPLFGACAAALPATVYLAATGATADLLSPDAAAAAALAAIAFAMALVLLVPFMRNLKERMKIWTGSRRIGIMERICGGIFGVACGLLLAATPYALYASLQPDPGQHPAWARQSIVVQYLSNASEAVKNAVSTYLPQAAKPPRREQ